MVGSVGWKVGGNLGMFIGILYCKLHGTLVGWWMGIEELF